MTANEAQLLSLIDGKKQFTIPIYQRTYSWLIPQCEKLFEDILKVGNNNSIPSHFIGSIVYFKPSNETLTSMPESLVIDGQQRLTTISILLLAIIKFLKTNNNMTIEDDETWEEIFDTYITNKHKKDDSKYKLLLTRKDKETYIKLVNDIDLNESDSKRIIENYKYYRKRINNDNVVTLYRGIKKLLIVDVSLELDKDNPQLIFESLNSTGLDLSQADLIRNYVLMGQESEKQTYLYEKYWYPMEQSFGDNISFLPWFIRDYLTMKEGSIPRIGNVYETYKKYFHNNFGLDKIEDAIKDLYLYSKYYTRIVLLKEPDNTLLASFKNSSNLKIDTAFPLLLAIYKDYEDEVISQSDLIEIIKLINSYIFRRAICGIPTNGLNKTFCVFYKNIKRETYLESIKAHFLLLNGFKRFPANDEFEKELQIKDVYNFRTRNYLLESLENSNCKELINAEDYTIEHILPQNPNASKEWKNELGDDYENIKSKYLHTIGNLTLTAYNSELSDKPFSDKKKIIDKSPLFLNESVRSESNWNEGTILKRAAILSKRALHIWAVPKLSDDILKQYREQRRTKEEGGYSIEDYEHLDSNFDLYKALEKRILNLDSSVYVVFTKAYIAFKSDTNFVDIIPLKSKLKLSLNMSFDKIKDPENICTDASNRGSWGNDDVEIGFRKNLQRFIKSRWGNGDVEIGFSDINDIDYVMDLIKQALAEQIELE